MKTLRDDKLINAISSFRDKIAEHLEDQPAEGEVTSPLQDGRVDISPNSPFEALLDERQKETRRELEEIKGRVNSLVFMILGAIFVNLLIKLLS